MDLRCDSNHFWLAFVTESGRVFDLDLSACRFCSAPSFSCIVEVTNPTDQSVLNGICNRHSTSDVNYPGFARAIYTQMSHEMSWIDDHKKGIQRKLTLGDMKYKYSIFHDKMAENFHHFTAYADFLRTKFSF